MKFNLLQARRERQTANQVAIHAASVALRIEKREEQARLAREVSKDELRVIIGKPPRHMSPEDFLHTVGTTAMELSEARLGHAPGVAYDPLRSHSLNALAARHPSGYDRGMTVVLGPRDLIADKVALVATAPSADQIHAS